MAEKLEHISGTIGKIIFKNPESDFAVLQVIPEDEIIPIIATGTIPNPVIGQTVELFGHWNEHSKYGKQFQFEDFKASAPKGKNAMVKYLSSDLIRGIGKVFAERIAKKFGEDTIDIILHQPELLHEIDGIGEMRAKRIAESVKKAYSEQASLQKLMVFLFECGFGTGMVKRIWRRYGDSALDIVKQNPYILAEEVWGIGFATADKLAQSSGITHDDPRRISAGILYTLQRAAADGHCYFPKNELIQQANKILDAENDLVQKVLDQSASVEKVICDDDKIYIPKFYTAEEEVSRLLADIVYVPPKKQIHIAMAESLFNLAQRNLDFQYTDEQKQAIIGALAGKVIVITGGPGTGKTTIVRSILFGAKKLKWKIELAAPTGRAAKRLSEATHHPASTIHRLLKFNPGMVRFEIGRANPLNVDMLILDEVSMVDIELFWRVLSALPPDSRLVLVGDADQLPSVGPGAVLDDVIKSQKIPTVRLNQIMRQDEHGLIVRNAHNILRGRMPIIRNDAEDDFFMLTKDDPQQAQESIIELVCERIPKKYRLDPIKDIQVITPMHKGRCGALELNKLLRQKLNPNSSKSQLPFAVGDKVMQIANNYDLSVFNGEMGIVIATDANKGQIAVKFDIGDKVYDTSYWNQLRLAYAITVHKSQGSEYPVVVMPILTEHYIMLARNLLYTGITRAKRLLLLVGSKKALSIAVHNNRQMLRYTDLARRIGEKIGAEK
ncbi:ATP-dependent RecD-like DNA helicase [bacterium]|nr:MAG: ATP-dependent RecD-like DNA helicase [bacterium]